MDDRPTLQQVFLEDAHRWATRSTCLRRHVGCVIASEEGRPLSTGYNGSAPKAPHCTDVGCLIHEGHCRRCAHAEANAIGWAARKGVALEGSIAYTTAHPCPTCLLLLIMAGCKKIYYCEPYHEDEDKLSKVLSDGIIELEFVAFTGGSP